MFSVACNMLHVLHASEDHAPKRKKDRLSQAQSSSRRPVIKCPYCPVEQRPQDAEAVTF